jgi:hypothetical protein
VDLGAAILHGNGTKAGRTEGLTDEAASMRQRLGASLKSGPTAAYGTFFLRHKVKERGEVRAACWAEDRRWREVLTGESSNGSSYSARRRRGKGIIVTLL